MSYPTEDELRRKVSAECAALPEGEDAAGEVPLPLMNRMETPE